MYNYLLEVDGKDVPWDESFKCDYKNNAFEDCNVADIPNYVRELWQECGELNAIDSSTVGQNDMLTHDNFEIEDTVQNYESDDDENAGNTIPDIDKFSYVHELPFDFIRSKLFEHFDILFHQNKLVLPKSAKSQPTL